MPLFYELDRLNNFKSFLKVGFIWGFIYYLTVIFWLSMNIGTSSLVAFVSMLAAVLYNSLNIILTFFIIGIIKLTYRKNWIWFIPTIWTSVEYIRNMDLLTGGPWTSFANTQVDFLTLAQNVEITGIYGISFWILLLNIAIFKWMVSPYPKYLFILILIFIFPWFSGLILTPISVYPSNKTLSVATIQPNIHLSQKWKPGAVNANIENLLSLSKPFIKDKIDLIVWPESATSSYLLNRNKEKLDWIQSELGQTYLLSGIPYYENIDNNRYIYNSIAMISRDSVFGIYNKMALVPLAEYIPLSNYFPKLKNLNIGQANFTKGSDYKIFTVNDVNIASMVCFESVIPSINSEFVRRGAEILVYVVNDGWYEYPPEPQQHAKQAVYRAIENRRTVVRSTNTGISMIIEPNGNIKKKISLNKSGVITDNIVALNDLTFYSKNGDIFAQFNVLLSMILIIGILFRRK